MKPLLLLFLVLSFTSFSQQIPFNLTPDWESTPSGHIATGLGIADIDGDGHKDLVVANGNDISRQRLSVYHNNGDGTFPLLPSWESDDIDYHGHLAVGDIDSDGDIDVAVSVYIGPSGFSSPGKVKVYYNNNGTLESTPSFQSDPFYTFSCALGDADGDGDLDLAAAAGEPYSQLEDYGKVFINDNGSFSATPEWESDNLMGPLDVEFGDINRDGSLDLVFACEYSDNYVFFANGQGIIGTSPGWHSDESENFINSVDIGYGNDPENAMVVMTENDQLGGQGRVRLYDFQTPIPISSPADWYSTSIGYGSGIILCDLTGDMVLDLIYGGWWRPVKVHKGDADGFEDLISFTSSTSSVVEAILMSDLGGESFLEESETITISSSMEGRNLLILDQQIIEELVAVRRNGNLLSDEDFSWIPGKSWIAFTDAFTVGDEFEMEYKYSPHPDMVITNWDSGKGNYIFYNTNIPIGVKENSFAINERLISKVWPIPAKDHINIETARNILSVTLCDAYGKNIQHADETVLRVGEGSIRLSTKGLAKGMYFIKATGRSGTETAKIIIE